MIEVSPETLQLQYSLNMLKLLQKAYFKIIQEIPHHLIILLLILSGSDVKLAAFTLSFMQIFHAIFLQYKHETNTYIRSIKVLLSLGGAQQKLFDKIMNINHGSQCQWSPEVFKKNLASRSNSYFYHDKYGPNMNQKFWRFSIILNMQGYWLIY